MCRAYEGFRLLGLGIVGIIVDDGETVLMKIPDNAPQGQAQFTNLGTHKANFSDLSDPT